MSNTNTDIAEMVSVVTALLGEATRAQLLINNEKHEQAVDVVREASALLNERLTAIRCKTKVKMVSLDDGISILVEAADEKGRFKSTFTYDLKIK
jgi:hypothetical protein